MAGLHIRLAHGDKMIVNGAAIQFLSDADLRFANKVRLVYGRQLMAPADANTAARRIYFAVQNAYVGEPHESEAATREARLLIAMFRGVTTSASARHVLDEIHASLDAGDFYRAIRAARRIIRHEDAVLGRPCHEAAKNSPAFSDR